MIAKEVSALPRSTFHLSQAMKNKGAEPPNYKQLHEKSALRAVVQALQSRLDSSSGYSKAADADSLLALLSSGSGRLPPLDWSFLRPVATTSSVLPSVVACQAQHSSSGSKKFSTSSESCCLFIS